MMHEQSGMVHYMDVLEAAEVRGIQRGLTPCETNIVRLPFSIVANSPTPVPVASTYVYGAAHHHDLCATAPILEIPFDVSKPSNCCMLDHGCFVVMAQNEHALVSHDTKTGTERRMVGKYFTDKWVDGNGEMYEKYHLSVFDKDKILVTCYSRRCVLLVDHKSLQIQDVFQLPNLNPFRACGHSNGMLYVLDKFYGILYMYDMKIKTCVQKRSVDVQKPRAQGAFLSFNDMVVTDSNIWLLCVNFVKLSEDGDAAAAAVGGLDRYASWNEVHVLSLDMTYVGRFVLDDDASIERDATCLDVVQTDAGKTTQFSFLAGGRFYRFQCLLPATPESITTTAASITTATTTTATTTTATTTTATTTTASTTTATTITSKQENRPADIRTHVDLASRLSVFFENKDKRLCLIREVGDAEQTTRRLARAVAAFVQSKGSSTGSSRDACSVVYIGPGRQIVAFQETLLHTLCDDTKGSVYKVLAKGTGGGRDFVLYSLATTATAAPAPATASDSLRGEVRFTAVRVDKGFSNHTISKALAKIKGLDAHVFVSDHPNDTILAQGLASLLGMTGTKLCVITDEWPLGSGTKDATYTQ